VRTFKTVQAMVTDELKRVGGTIDGLLKAAAASTAENAAAMSLDVTTKLVKARDTLAALQAFVRLRARACEVNVLQT